MSHQPDPNPETELTHGDQLPPEFILPIEGLFSVDPLDLTLEDLTLLVSHYRNQRLMFEKLQEKPKKIESNFRGKLDAEASKERINSILRGLIGGDDD